MFFLPDLIVPMPCDGTTADGNHIDALGQHTNRWHISINRRRLSNMSKNFRYCYQGLGLPDGLGRCLPHHCEHHVDCGLALVAAEGEDDDGESGEVLEGSCGNSGKCVYDISPVLRAAIASRAREGLSGEADRVLLDIFVHKRVEAIEQKEKKKKRATDEL